MQIIGKLKIAFKSILDRIGDPLDDNVLYGPLHNQNAVDAYKVIIYILIYSYIFLYIYSYYTLSSMKFIKKFYFSISFLILYFYINSN